MGTQAQGAVIAPVTKKFAETESGQFRSLLSELWRSAQTIGETVADEVESGRVEPIQGAAIMACLTGQLFGYTEFHRELRPSDLAYAGVFEGNGQSKSRN